jgi:hypothetical protein
LLSVAVDLKKLCQYSLTLSKTRYVRGKVKRAEIGPAGLKIRAADFLGGVLMLLGW